MKEAIKIAYVSTFPPRECGIATFTADLTAAMDDLLAPAFESRVAAVNIDDISRYHYPRKVIFQIDQYSRQEYVETAEKINRMNDIKLVNIQHEFGIFGGKYGAHILSFLEVLKKPSIVTFHSILPSPDKEFYNIVRSIAEKASGLTAMTNLSREIIIREYGVADEKISVIPHGIHSMPYNSSARHKSALGISKKVNLLTFGFLNRGKGLEYVIEALPKVVKAYPDLIYIILGVTHPNVLKEEGESYRNFLIQKVRYLNLSSHVNFYNEYVSLDELLNFLKAADIYIATSLNPNQAVSGTLSYALGSGRPVISTSFAQAKELITSEAGILVNFRDPGSYAEAIMRLLKDPSLREQMGKNAYFRTRNMTWENVALEYSKLFSKYSLDIAEVSEHKKIPRVNLNHMFRLTDNFGIIQFAKLSLPDISSGYTLDDNARALIVACVCYGELGRALKAVYPDKQKSELLKRIEIYLGFIESALGEDRVFCNYIRSDRSVDLELNKKDNLDDANGRALWALAVVAAADYLPDSARNKAIFLLKKRIEIYKMFESPRSIAFYAKGVSFLLKKMQEIGGKDLKELLVAHCDRLISLYRGVSSEEWQWFESYLTYSNAILPEALILGYKHTGNREYLDIGTKTLDFLIGKTFVSGIYMPIGQDGWHHRIGERRYFDQQPEDVSAMVCALATAHSITGKDSYKKLMYEAFNWFLGDNSLKQVVYDRVTGGCYDGVGERNINLNQGAESITSYLLARFAII
ncbi:MAG: glycosyltransferase [Candidatus Omnitrophica bacterium]|nr:glycosyltransferase [Candidatus Omnitrophota bacterium]MDD5553836.1 glycosyltransferase [Candidatus Omnitrophota bacterium]